MSTLVKRALGGLLGVFVLLQFFQIDKTNPPITAGQDLLQLTSPPSDVAALIKSACYDCHAHTTAYPWYASIQPVGWWLKGHIEEGREHLNFSAWGSYPADKRAHKAEECAEEIREQEMPLKVYPITHPEARLSPEQRDRLAAWFEVLQASAGQDTPARLRKDMPMDKLPKAPQPVGADNPVE